MHISQPTNGYEQTGNPTDSEDKETREWSKMIFFTGSGPSERLAKKRLTEGVQITWEGETRLFQIASARGAKQAKVNKKQADYERIEAEAKLTDGRRLHIYRLGIWMADSEFAEILWFQSVSVPAAASLLPLHP